MYLEVVNKGSSHRGSAVRRHSGRVHGAGVARGDREVEEGHLVDDAVEEVVHVADLVVRVQVDVCRADLREGALSLQPTGKWLLSNRFQ